MGLFAGMLRHAVVKGVGHLDLNVGSITSELPDLR